MDPIVAAALKKWPNVPHCYAWLALDARGDWYMRDDRIQAAGPFPRVKGSRIDHEKLREFIARNYASDDHGAWFFQNGPQRVYVELEAAPWVFARGNHESCDRGWRGWFRMLDAGLNGYTPSCQGESAGFEVWQRRKMSVDLQVNVAAGPQLNIVN